MYIRHSGAATRGVLKNFAIFTGKQLPESLFNKVAGSKKRFNTGVFL